MGLTTQFHTDRFATWLLKRGYDIRTVQPLLGHADVTATMIDTYVLHCGPSAVRSLIDNA